MAHNTNTVVPEPQVVPYQTPPDVAREVSDLPRASIVFALNETIPAVLLADTATLSCSMTLPANFAYSLAEAFFTLQFDTDTGAAALYDKANFRIFTDGAGGASLLGYELGAGIGLTLGLTNDQAGSVVFGRPLEPQPRQTFFNEAGASPQAFASFQNDDSATAAAAGELKGVVRFLQYDIRQAYDVRVNAATPVRCV